MSAKVAVSCVLFLWMPAGWALAAADNSRQTAGTVAAGDVAGWILGLTREEKEKLRAAMLQEVTTVLKKMTGKSQVKELFFTSFVMQ